jgi:hypothetical protein
VFLLALFLKCLSALLLGAGSFLGGAILRHLTIVGLLFDFGFLGLLLGWLLRLLSLRVLLHGFIVSVSPLLGALQIRWRTATIIAAYLFGPCWFFRWWAV